ncbi:MAG: porphobilinogen synthase [Nitrososphaera sp.]|uniref:Delta-aminolevulinic acid dehydratase n=1 Tax=Nitrososphaera gargensis (strain Ga9.2) TaxID=1237085 RepID=K0IKZ6_NITGG|nr:porphobilinogen synthase [Candidatus Nitrososphaera gargensis]AFU59232.1 delta-aminolevulinic acid dehydratase [Candidatus Nitrososphaera gargensis Ga9.2]
MKKSSNSNAFPNVRLRRLRTTPAVRDLLQETRLSAKDLIAPVFVQEGLKKPEEIGSMPDIQRLPLSRLAGEVERIMDLGISAIILFGLPSHKDAEATSAFDDRGIVQKSVELVRKQFGNKVAIVTDVCLCQYTTHGHCGLVVDKKIDNDRSIDTLAKVAVSHAKAGADIVAPSAMMDGQVQAIRKGLDASGFSEVAIMGYSAKQASPLYAPFRDAAHSAPEFGDRCTYQMPFSNAKEAMREIETDIAEGVDIVMIKPAIPYLDLIYKARQATNLPICAYSVSGEYALIKAAAMNGWVDENAVMTEFLTSIKRAGANVIITYQAKKMAELLSR